MSTIATTVASGLTATFTVPFAYILKSHVKVYVDDVLLTETTDYTWPDAANITLVAGNPAAGIIVERRRVTPKAPLTSFIAGELDHIDLNAAVLQANYIGEEGYDLALQLDNDLGGLTAGDIEDAIAAAEQTALDAIATAADRVQTGLDVVAAEADRVTVAADTATVAADKAIVAADKATVIADKAIVAADKATVIADKGIVLGYRNEVEADRSDVQGDKVIASAAADAAVAAQAAAEAALAATLSAYDNFDDRYLGAKAVAPTLDNDGNAIIDGSLYFDTAEEAMMVRASGNWVVAYVSAGGAGVPLLANNGSDYTASTFRTNLDLYTTGAVDTLLNDKAPKANATFTGTFSIPSAVITFANMVNGAALSLLGRSANSAGVMADITAGTDGHVLRRSGTAIGFGTILAAAVSDFTSAVNTLIAAAVGVTVQAYDAQLSSLIRQESKSAAYTLVLTDGGKQIFHPSADTTARIWTIPANSSVAFPIGTAVTFINQNAGGVITIAITTDTMRLAGAGTTGSRTLAANGIATAVKVTSTEWIISGTGLT